MSPTDNLADAQAKMQEYLDNGMQLGWLFNRKAKQVEVYRAGQTKAVLQQPDQLSGEPTLPGFTLKLDGFW
jgi:Uma2 family endonuclease